MTLYQKTFQEFENKYLGCATMAIIGQSCLGSVAVMYILINGTSFFQMVQLAFVVVSCMGVNGAILSQQSPKLVFNLVLNSAMVSFLMIIINTIFL
ncbi:hypothetical protein [Flavobacterium sp. GT3R68]|uniref:hypothetical protein n=1 Tax=Flavobacterium sp. GT3R68 TaxID=2594437 RepID=UPI000F89A161|nr:hypothetical protein [Flavobacterium sp. GT3R68]RTY93984.1 hypothetical protein EKL32_13975 [Flavobacterium sp. GSN2]TRW93402.1 hypothetical protein FNW07_00410 [Flavobacterium sp. GT3R68]